MQGYYRVSSVEDKISRDKEFQKNLKKVLRDGSLEERIDLVKSLRILEKESYLWGYAHPRILDRCELDAAIFSGYLDEPIKKRFERWEKISEEIGDMRDLDLILFFKFSPFKGEQDRSMAVDNVEAYKKVEKDYEELWKCYIKKKETPIYFIEPSNDLKEKYSKVLEIIDQYDHANRIVFSGPPHGGKTSCLDYLFEGIFSRDNFELFGPGFHQ